MKLSNKTKITLLTTLLITLIILIITGYNFFIKKDLKISNLEDEIVEVNSTYKKTNPKICYGSIFLCKPLKYKETGTVNTKKLGNYKIKYKINYQNKEKTIIKTVKVKDTTKPKIIIPPEKLIVCPNGTPLNTIIKATDNYDGDITNKIEIEKNGKNFIYKVKDSSNNQTTIIKQTEIKDNIKPTITLKGKQIEYIKINSTYKEQGAVAYDTCDGDITNNITITNNVDPNTKGIYNVKYEVTDKSGNKNETIRTVKVEEEENLIKTNGKTIYLTFDDGPSKDTEKLLNVLKKYNIKATFFVTKNVNNYKEILKREYNEGHTIGLHSWSHNYSIYKDEKTYFYDLHKIENAVYEITGHKSKIIRFPGGSSNTISKSYQKGIMSKITKKVEEQGYIYFDWNVYSGDAGETQSTKQVAKNVITTLTKQETNVVLQHDIHTYSVNAVEKIIKYGLKQGYNFAPITENTPLIQHKVNN